MTIKVRDSRAMIATIRHALKAGNLGAARRWAGELIDGDWSEATPAQIQDTCTAIEGRLDEARM